jgi:hypothetical protein
MQSHRAARSTALGPRRSKSSTPTHSGRMEIRPHARIEGHPLPEYCLAALVALSFADHCRVLGRDAVDGIYVDRTADHEHFRRRGVGLDADGDFRAVCQDLGPGRVNRRAGSASWAWALHRPHRVGAPAERGPTLSARPVVDRHLLGPGDHAHRPGAQSSRGRLAGRARSAVEDLNAVR